MQQCIQAIANLPVLSTRHADFFYERMSTHPPMRSTAHSEGGAGCEVGERGVRGGEMGDLGWGVIEVKFVEETLKDQVLSTPFAGSDGQL
ncbi:hypothetical protein D3C78_1749510 [compost metagenome]